MIELKKEQCCGCGNCSMVCPTKAIEMLEDEKGFLYPEVTQANCIHCNQCDTVCAFQKEREETGNIRCVMALQHWDDEVVSSSSSGGAFTAISDLVLARGGVVYGAVFDGETQNVIYKKAETAWERNQMRGSKYVQAALNDIFEDVKNNVIEGKWTLFVGTPCQVEALLLYLGERYDRLITVDLLCHGVPSPKVFQSHLRHWEKKRGKSIKNFSFRDKRFGYMYTHVAAFEDGTEETSLDLGRLLKLYTLNMRESCYKCKYAVRHRYGDITIGDFWNSGKKIGIFDNRGYSVCMANSDIGEKVLDAISTEVILTRVTLEDIMQQSLQHPVEKSKDVDGFWNTYLKKGYEKALEEYAPQTAKSLVYRTILRYLHLFHMDTLAAKIDSYFR